MKQLLTIICIFVFGISFGQKEQVNLERKTVNLIKVSSPKEIEVKLILPNNISNQGYNLKSINIKNEQISLLKLDKTYPTEKIEVISNTRIEEIHKVGLKTSIKIDQISLEKHSKIQNSKTTSLNN